MFHKGNNYLT